MPPETAVSSAASVRAAVAGDATAESSENTVGREVKRKLGELQLESGSQSSESKRFALRASSPSGELSRHNSTANPSPSVADSDEWSLLSVPHATEAPRRRPEDQCTLLLKITEDELAEAQAQVVELKQIVEALVVGPVGPMPPPRPSPPLVPAAAAAPPAPENMPPAVGPDAAQSHVLPRPEHWTPAWDASQEVQAVQIWPEQDIPEKPVSRKQRRELMEHGASQDDAEAALRQCDNDVDAALIYLAACSESGTAASSNAIYRKVSQACKQAGTVAKEVDEVRTAFLRKEPYWQDVNGWRIVRIERIQNQQLWTSYFSRRKAVSWRTLQKENPANEQLLWYSCDAQEAEAILQLGFDARTMTGKTSDYSIRLYDTATRLLPAIGHRKARPNSTTSAGGEPAAAAVAAAAAAAGLRPSEAVRMTTASAASAGAATCSLAAAAIAGLPNSNDMTAATASAAQAAWAAPAAAGQPASAIPFAFGGLSTASQPAAAASFAFGAPDPYGQPAAAATFAFGAEPPPTTAGQPAAAAIFGFNMPPARPSANLWTPPAQQTASNAAATGINAAAANPATAAMAQPDKPCPPVFGSSGGSTMAPAQQPTSADINTSFSRWNTAAAPEAMQCCAAQPSTSAGPAADVAQESTAVFTRGMSTDTVRQRNPGEPACVARPKTMDAGVARAGLTAAPQDTEMAQEWGLAPNGGPPSVARSLNLYSPTSTPASMLTPPTIVGAGTGGRLRRANAAPTIQNVPPPNPEQLATMRQARAEVDRLTRARGAAEREEEAKLQEFRRAGQIASGGRPCTDDPFITSQWHPHNCGCLACASVLASDHFAWANIEVQKAQKHLDQLRLEQWTPQPDPDAAAAAAATINEELPSNRRHQASSSPAGSEAAAGGSQQNRKQRRVAQPADGSDDMFAGCDADDQPMADGGAAGDGESWDVVSQKDVHDLPQPFGSDATVAAAAAFANSADGPMGAPHAAAAAGRASGGPTNSLQQLLEDWNCDSDGVGAARESAAEQGMEVTSAGAAAQPQSAVQLTRFQPMQATPAGGGSGPVNAAAAGESAAAGAAVTKDAAAAAASGSIEGSRKATPPPVPDWWQEHVQQHIHRKEEEYDKLRAAQPLLPQPMIPNPNDGPPPGSAAAQKAAEQAGRTKTLLLCRVAVGKVGSIAALDGKLEELTKPPAGSDSMKQDNVYYIHDSLQVYPEYRVLIEPDDDAIAVPRLHRPRLG